ncbi:MAG: hypothetical protein LLF92_03330 [Planctomycetaceae bacterium]|nr:hypothetical protein [Planctomycetaceae bacterium]
MAKKNIYKKRLKKSSIAQNTINETKIGFDYGIRPQIMSVANIEFVNLWNKSKSMAMAYTVLPKLDLRIGIPLAGIVFEQFNFAEKLFKLMKSWMVPPNNESAVDIYFIENKKQNSYYLMMGVNPEQLLIRTFGEDSERDFLLIGMTLYVSHRFPLSNNFKIFKKIAQNNEVLICPVKSESYKDYPEGTSVYIPISQDQIGFSEGFIKKDVKFLEKDSIVTKPQDQFIIDTIDKIEKKECKKEKPLVPLIPKPEEVGAFRERQLKRFHTVTTARLSFNQSFNNIRDTLKDRYSEWQIIQAACNLYVRGNWPAYGYGKNVDMIQIYQKLRNSTQDATESAILAFKFDVKDLKKQIKNDIKYLHSCVCPTSQKEPEQELKSKGYL